MSARERLRPLVVGKDGEFRFEKKEKPPPPVRDMKDLLIEPDQSKIDWPELQPGTRAWNVGRIYFKGVEKKDLVLGTDVSAGYLKTTSQPVTAIEYLHAKLRCGQAGAETISIDEFISMPKITSPGSAYWLADEGDAPSEAGMTLGSVASNVKTVGAFLDYSRLLKVVTGPLVGGVVARELFGLLAAAVDSAALCGSGADGEPLGISNHPDVDVADGSSFSLVKAAARVKVVEDGNGEPTAWIMDPASAETLRKRESASGNGFLIDGNGRMLNIPVLVTSGVANTIILGDFRELAILTKAIELQVNPYVSSTDGKIRVTAFHYLDVSIRHIETFAVATSVS